MTPPPQLYLLFRHCHVSAVFFIYTNTRSQPHHLRYYLAPCLSLITCDTLPQSYNIEEPSTFLLMTDRLLVDVEHTMGAFNTVTPDSPVTSMLHAVHTMLSHIRTNRDFHSIPLLLKKVCLNSIVY